MTYAKHLPWTIRAVHASHEALRMLRLMARRDHNLPLTDDQLARVNAWQQRMADRHEVVAYSPEVGFYYVTGEPTDGIPVIGSS